LRFGTTFTVQQSGALASLDSLAAPARFVTVIGPSGLMLRSAAAGDLDVVLTHAPALEARVLEGRWLRRCPFVTSRFAVVGPAPDPAAVARAASAADAFRRIARAEALFVTRGDSSGTHERERAVWRAAGVDPEPEVWYLESGSDQATTLRLAAEWGAYALADLPTLARQRDLAVTVLFTRDTVLVNRYTLYVVRVEPAPVAAAAFASWVLAQWRPRVIGLRLADGTPAFEAATGVCEAADTTGA
jgi:tungstate transport system substrate-binding protein